MTKTLHDRFVAGLQSTSRETIYDTKAKGLALRVGPRGKTWYFVYRFQPGPSQWLKIGSYPALSLADARTASNTCRHLLDVKREDPATLYAAPEPTPEPAAIQATPVPRGFTFADLVPVYINFQKGRIKSWDDEQGKIDRYLLPAWGPLLLTEITRKHVHELLDTIAGKGLTVGVNRVQSTISRMFTVALDRSLIAAHPAARMIKRFTEIPGTRVLSDDELRALWKGLDAHPSDAATVIRLRLLLGQRGEETMGMLWSELDLAAAEWFMPGARTKNKRPHLVPLPTTALRLLEQTQTGRLGDEPQVFATLTNSRWSDDYRALAEIHGGRYEWKDLRRTVATRLAGLSFDETTIDRVSNRAPSSVTAKHYNKHAYVEEKRRALTAWDVELRRILANKPKAKAPVLRMRARGR